MNQVPYLSYLQRLKCTYNLSWFVNQDESPSDLELLQLLRQVHEMEWKGNYITHPLDPRYEEQGTAPSTNINCLLNISNFICNQWDNLQ